MRHGLGYTPDTPDDRDMTFATAQTSVTTPPPKKSNRHLVTEILRQGWLGACVGKAIKQAIHADAVRQEIERLTQIDPNEIVDTKQVGESIEWASSLLLYLSGRAQHGDKLIDSGTSIRLVFKAINRSGFCREKLWPYDPFDFRGPAPTEAMQEAIDCANVVAKDGTEILRYRRIWSVGSVRIDEVKRALANDRLVVQGASITVAMVNHGYGFRVFDTPKPEEEIAGGHAWALTGYDNERKIVEGAGSWGEDVHDDGYHWITYDFLEKQSRDLWVVELSPKFKERLRVAA